MYTFTQTHSVRLSYTYTCIKSWSVIHIRTWVHLNILFCLDVYWERITEGDPTRKVTLKILYTPHNIHSQRVVDRASKMFQTLSYVMNWTQDIIECMDSLTNYFHPDSSFISTLHQIMSMYLMWVFSRLSIQYYVSKCFILWYRYIYLIVCI